MSGVAWGRIVLGGVLLGSAVAIAREISAHASPARGSRFESATATYPSGVPLTDTAYTLATWQPTIRRLIATEYPRVSEPFAEAWGTMESGWNPCSVGDPGQLGEHSSEPAEIGLGQLYNPDDFHAFGQAPAPFRAYAPAAAPLAAQYRAARADLHAAQAAGKPDTDPAVVDAKHRMAVASRTMQQRTRDLTAAEMDAQVRWTLLAKINQGITNADHVTAQYSLSHWSLPDYWKLVKAPHALPAILGNGMPAVVKKLGRAPSSWKEFRTVLGMEGNSQWKRALDACEVCGNAVAPAVV